MGLPADVSTVSDEEFRVAAQEWLAANLVDDLASLKGRGGPGDEEIGFEIRERWEKVLGEAGWIGIGWPTEFGGRNATIGQQIIWAEEYARAQAPGRVNHMGENLLGPTLIAHGTKAQCDRFLPAILSGDERWCQGYSEPNAGSDLANVQTKAVLDGDQWIINGQKVWTSLAHVSHWCFLVARTEAGSARHKGLSFLLVPMDQPGVESRAIVQITGGGEFNEVFLSDAVTDADMIVGDPGKGWGVAMDLLAFERGISTLAQQVGFERELDDLIVVARERGVTADPVMRQRLVESWIGLQLMKWNGLRSMGSGVPGPEASISKLFWGTWHRDLGELAMDIGGIESMIAEGFPYELTLHQKLFLFTRSETIYGGSNEIQRNVLGERVLGLPKEPL
jgi:alkylation response protein AidB-like acyl-CoA dehydrogenase